MVFFSLPLAVKVTRMVGHKNHLPAREFAVIDAATAQLHLAFGLLMVLSMVLHRLVMGA